MKSHSRLLIVSLLMLFSMMVSSLIQVQGQGMYGPLYLYSDLYSSTNGYVYSTSQVSPSVPHYAHRYKATAKINAPNGSSTTNTSAWAYNSAYTLTDFDFGSLYLDGSFTSNNKGEGWCNIANVIFATALATKFFQQTPWIKLGAFGGFDPTSIRGIQNEQETTISIPYAYSNNAPGRKFEASFGINLASGDLVIGDVTTESSGTKTVQSGQNARVTAKYKSILQTGRNGTFNAAIFASAGTVPGASAVVLEPSFVMSASACTVNQVN
jgi:hypothetical protein